MSEDAKTFEELTPLKVGNKIIVRCVTHYYTGQIVGVGQIEILLTECAWLPDTGRWAKCLVEGLGELKEVEPFPKDKVVAIGRGAIVDASIWDHELPSKAQ